MRTGSINKWLFIYSAFQYKKLKKFIIADERTENVLRENEPGCFLGFMILFKEKTISQWGFIDGGGVRCFSIEHPQNGSCIASALSNHSRKLAMDIELGNEN